MLHALRHVTNRCVVSLFKLCVNLFLYLLLLHLPHFFLASRFPFIALPNSQRKILPSEHQRASKGCNTHRADWKTAALDCLFIAMDRHGLRKKNGLVLHQVVKQFADHLQSLPTHRHNSLALIIKQWVDDYANKMSEYSCSLASPASSDTVTTVHDDDSDVQNLLGGCDRDSPQLAMEKYLPSAPFLESSACSSINDRFSIDSLQTAHVTRSNVMDPCDIQDALVDTAWSSKLMVLDGKWVAVPMISQQCDLGRCFDTNASGVPINTHEPVSWEFEWDSCDAIATIKGGEGLPTAGLRLAGSHCGC